MGTLPVVPTAPPSLKHCEFRSTPTAAFAACTSATAFTARTSCLQSLSCTSRCAARIGRTQRHRDPLLKNNADFTPFVALPISSRFPLCLFFNLRVGTRVTRLLALVLFLSSFLPPLLSGFELCFAPYTLFLFLLCAFLLQFALVLVALCLAKLRSHMSFFSLFLQCWCCCCCC